MSLLRLRILRVGSLLILGGTLAFHCALLGLIYNAHLADGGIELCGKFGWSCALTVLGLSVFCLAIARIQVGLYIGVTMPLLVISNWAEGGLFVFAGFFSAVAITQVLKSACLSLRMSPQVCHWQRVQKVQAGLTASTVLAMFVGPALGLLAPFLACLLVGLCLTSVVLYLHALADLFFAIQEIIDVRQRACPVRPAVLSVAPQEPLALPDCKPPAEQA